LQSGIDERRGRLGRARNPAWKICPTVGRISAAPTVQISLIFESLRVS
jgi:hypothetical protein